VSWWAVGRVCKTCVDSRCKIHETSHSNNNFSAHGGTSARVLRHSTGPFPDERMQNSAYCIVLSSRVCTESHCRPFAISCLYIYPVTTRPRDSIFALRVPTKSGTGFP